jgi:hypothetical protein
MRSLIYTPLLYAGEGELMVRTYWFVSGFNEASDNLDLQPFARVDHVEACSVTEWYFIHQN